MLFILGCVSIFKTINCSGKIVYSEKGLIIIPQRILISDRAFDVVGGRQGFGCNRVWVPFALVQLES